MSNTLAEDPVNYIPDGLYGSLPGLNKREFFAAHAPIEVLASKMRFSAEEYKRFKVNEKDEDAVEQLIAIRAVIYAEALIKVLNL